MSNSGRRSAPFAFRITSSGLLIAASLLVLLVASPTFAQDTDGDGLDDADEIGTHGTNPALYDTDDDGVSDGDEVLHYPTDPLDDDSDDDGLKDGEERLSTSGFGPPRAIPVPVGIDWLEPDIVEIDSNPGADLVYVGRESAIYFPNTIGPGGADFAPMETITALFSPFFSPNPPIDFPHRLLDFDHDGDIDLVRYGQSGVEPDFVYDYHFHENRLDEPSGDFAPPVAASLYPVPTDLHDLDGDGDLDFVRVSSDQVTWIRRESDETLPIDVVSELLFPTGMGHSCPLWPEGLDAEVVDIDGDGDLDFVVMCFQSSDVLWIENRLTPTAGHFEPPALLFKLDGHPHGFEVANVDSTPLPEIVTLTTPSLVVEGWDPRVSIAVEPNPFDLRRRADPPLPYTFVLGQTVAAGTHALALETADVDGDGIVDFLLESSWPIESIFGTNLLWLENRLAARHPSIELGGVFADVPSSSCEWSARCEPFYVADLDGDGAPDVLSLWTRSWYRNVMGHGSDPLVADSDGDGLEDGDEATTHGTRPSRADTDGDGVDDGTEVGTAGTDPLDPDEDDDGLIDGDEWVQAGFGEEHTYVTGVSCCLRPPIGGGFGALVGPNIHLADVDRDGDLDWMIGGGLDLGGPYFENHLNAAQGDFERVDYFWIVRDHSEPSSFTVAEDADGEIVAALGAGYLEGEIAWHGVRQPLPEEPWSGDAIRFEPTAVTVTTDAGGVERLQAADFDGDGDLDVLAAERLDGEVVWYANRLDEVTADFAAGVAIDSAAAGTEDAHAADLDGDGDPDVIVGAHDDGEVRWFENRLDEETADFGGPHVIDDEALDVFRVIALDFDGDGDLDPVANSINGYDTVWYENRLDDGLAFVARGMGFQPYGGGGNLEMAAGDLDGDGDEDLVWTHARDWALVAFVLSEGSESYVDVSSLTTSFEDLGDVALGDLDGDGDLDLTVTGLGDVAWFENLMNYGTDRDDPDSDDDGLLDGFEVEWGFGPLVTTDTSADTDGDGLDLLAEQAAGTSPLTDDTDGDGYTDGHELADGGDPLDRRVIPVPEFANGGLVVLVMAVLELRRRRRRA